MDNPHVRVGAPAGCSVRDPGAGRGRPHRGLNAPVYLDPSPSGELITRCVGSSPRGCVDQARLSLGELLPDGPLWTGDASGGLEVPIGAPATPRCRCRCRRPPPLAACSAGQAPARPPCSWTSCTACAASTGRNSSPPICWTSLAKGRSLTSCRSPTIPLVCRTPERSASEPDRAAGVELLRRLARQRVRRFDTGQILPRIVCAIDRYGATGRDDFLAQEADAAAAGLAQHGGRVGIQLRS